MGGSSGFGVSGAAYDSFMGRYSTALASVFCDLVAVVPGETALDVGCGPGALTTVLARRLGADAVAAVDPSPSFVDACRNGCPGVDVRAADAAQLPFTDASFDTVTAQLVLHFVGDPDRAGHEFRRVLVEGGVAAACVWDLADGMEMLRLFWDAALSVDPGAPDEARVLRFGQRGEIATWLAEAGFVDVREERLTVGTTYTGRDELWAGFLLGVGPAGRYLVSRPAVEQAEVRAVFDRLLGPREHPFELTASAWAATGRNPARPV